MKGGGKGFGFCDHEKFLRLEKICSLCMNPADRESMDSNKKQLVSSLETGEKGY